MVPDDLSIENSELPLCVTEKKQVRKLLKVRHHAFTENEKKFLIIKKKKKSYQPAVMAYCVMA